MLLAGNVEGRVYRLAPQLHSHGVVAPYIDGEVLFSESLTRPTVRGRYQDGARIIARRTDGQPGADGRPGAGPDVLFLVGADGQLTAATQAGTPVPRPGDTVVSLGPVPVPLSRAAESPARGQRPEPDRA